MASGSHSMAPKAAAAASPRYLLEMQIRAILSQKLWIWEPVMCVLTNLPANANAQ